MVCFVNVESVDRIIYSIFQRFDLEWETRTINLFTQAFDVTRAIRPVCLLPISSVLFTQNCCVTTGFGEAHQWAQAHFLF